MVPAEWHVLGEDGSADAEEESTWEDVSVGKHHKHKKHHKKHKKHHHHRCAPA